MSTSRPALSVVLPVYNEEELLEATIDKLVADLKATEPDFEVVLSQNGSTDRTNEVLDRLTAKHPNVRVVHFPYPDYGHALRNGYMHATGQVVVNFSVDWIDLDFLKMARPLVAQYDIVMGSKHAAPGMDRRPALRRYGGATFHWIVGKLFGLPVKDTHGLRAYRAETVQPLISRCRQGGGLFDTELVLRAYRAGLKLHEVPLHVQETRPARSGVAKRAIQAMRDLVRLRILLWRERKELRVSR